MFLHFKQKGGAIFWVVIWSISDTETGWLCRSRIFDVVISRQGDTNGDRGHSSATVRKYLLQVAEGSGSLKSTSKLSKGGVAFITFPIGLSQNHNFTSAQAAQMDSFLNVLCWEWGAISSHEMYQAYYLMATEIRASLSKTSQIQKHTTQEKVYPQLRPPRND